MIFSVRNLFFSYDDKEKKGKNFITYIVQASRTLPFTLPLEKQFFKNNF